MCCMVLLFSMCLSRYCMKASASLPVWLWPPCFFRPALLAEVPRVVGATVVVGLVLWSRAEALPQQTQAQPHPDGSAVYPGLKQVEICSWLQWGPSWTWYLGSVFKYLALGVLCSCNRAVLNTAQKAFLLTATLKLALGNSLFQLRQVCHIPWITRSGRNTPGSCSVPFEIVTF